MLIDNFVSYVKRTIPTYSPNVVLDVGSRDLEQSLEFKQVWPLAKILAFEPNPEQTDAIMALKPPDIDFFNIALGNEEKDITLHIPYGGNHGASSVLRPMRSAIVQSFYTKTVKMRKLSSVLTEQKIPKVDILWMDVQGFELSVLDGMDQFLATTDFIHLEASQVAYYEGHPVIRDVINYLTSHNFVVEGFEPAANHPYGEGDLLVRNANLLH